MVKRKDRTGRRQILQLNEEQSRPYSQPAKTVSQGPSSLVTSYDDSDESDSEETKRKKPADPDNGMVVKDAIDEQLADFLKEIDAISLVSQAEKGQDDDAQAGSSGDGLPIDPVPPPPPPEPSAEPEHQESNDRGGTQSEPEPTCVWVECMDDATGYIYYWNQVTNEVTWERPPEYEAYLALFAQYQEDSAAAALDAGGANGAIVENGVDSGVGDAGVGGRVVDGNAGVGGHVVDGNESSGTNVGSLGVYAGAAATVCGTEIPETCRSDEVPSKKKKRKLEPEIGCIIPITSYGSSDGSSSEESDGKSFTSLTRRGRLSKRQKSLSSTNTTKPGRLSPSPQVPIGPQLPETLIGPQLPETFIGPQLPEAMIGPQLPEVMIGPQLPEPMIGPQLPDMPIGPQLPEVMIGPQLPAVVIGPQLPEAMIGPQEPVPEVDPQPSVGMIGPQLPEEMIGPQLPKGMIGPQLPETMIGPQLPCGEEASTEPCDPQSLTAHVPIADGAELCLQPGTVESELSSVPRCVELSNDSALRSQLPDSSTRAEESSPAAVSTQSPDVSASSALSALVDYPGSPGLEEGEIVDDDDEEVAAADSCASEKAAPVAYPMMVGAKFQFGGAAEETACNESGTVSLDSKPDSTTKCDRRNSVSPRASRASRKAAAVKETKDASQHLVSYGDSESSDEDSDSSDVSPPPSRRQDSAQNKPRDETERPGFSRHRKESPVRSIAKPRKTAAFPKIAFVRSDEVLVLGECGKSADDEIDRRTPEVDAVERRLAPGTESSAESEEVDDFEDVERALDRALMESRKKEAARTQEKGESPSQSAEKQDDPTTERFADDSVLPQRLNGKGQVEDVGSLAASSDASHSVAATNTETANKVERTTAEHSVADRSSSVPAAPSVAQAVDIERAHGLLMDQLGLLNEGRDQRSSLIDLLVQTRTRMEDWRAGALDPDYLLLKLHETRLAVTRLQRAATLEPPLPSGWQRHWDR
ncbi:unnamed protein product, partial [Ixodes hexagonus]